MEQKVIDVFAENLRFARKARGYSQALMAERHKKAEEEKEKEAMKQVAAFEKAMRWQ